MGTGLLHLQLSHPAPRFGMVGQIYHDHVRGTRFRLSICSSGRFLWLHISGLDGRFPVVGDRGLQAGTSNQVFLVPPSGRSIADCWATRAATGKHVPTNVLGLGSISDQPNYGSYIDYIYVMHPFVVHSIVLRLLQTSPSD